MASPATTETLTGSLKVLFANIVAMEKRVDSSIRVFRFKPTVPSAPCIWNAIVPSRFELRDQVKHRDIVNIVTTLAFTHTDVEIEMDRALEMVDQFRYVIDTELYAPRPCGAKYAERASMQTSQPRFGEVALLGFDFGITFHLDRMIQPGA